MQVKKNVIKRRIKLAPIPNSPNYVNAHLLTPLPSMSLQPLQQLMQQLALKPLPDKVLEITLDASYPIPRPMA